MSRARIEPVENIDYDNEDRPFNAAKTESRASAAAAMLAMYKDGELRESGPIDSECVADLLTDIAHFCHREGYHFGDLFESAVNHWIAER